MVDDKFLSYEMMLAQNAIISEVVSVFDMIGMQNALDEMLMFCYY